MSFNKVNYENHKTKIMAENLNEIQDNLIKNNSDLITKQNQFAKRMFNNTTGKNYLNETDIKEGYYGDTNSDWNTFYSDWSARCIEIKLEAGTYTMSSSVDNTNVIFERYAINGVITRVSGNSFTFSLDEDSKVYITWSTQHHTYNNMKTMIELGKIVTEYEPYVPVPGSNNMNLKYVTPEQFGAKGDRITNDFDALNKCISHALENHEIVQADGTYFIANNKLDLNIQDLSVFINRIISTSNDYCIKLQGSSNVIVINNIYSNGDGFVISTDENHLQSNSNYVFIKNISSTNNCFYKYSHDNTARITYNNFNFLILGSETSDCIKDFGGGGSNIFNGNNCYCYALNGHAINIKNNDLSIYKNFVLEHDVKYGILCENAIGNVFENIRNTELADKITVDNDKYVIKFIGNSYGNEFKTPVPFIGVKNEINPFNIEEAQKKEINTYNSDCIVFNGTNVLKMNFLQKWLYYEDIPEYDIKRRLLNGDAYIVTYFNHTGIRLTHDVIRNIKQSLYKPYISDTYIPTIFNIKENTTIELNDFYFPLGISKIVIIQNDNNKAIVKDRHGNIIFDGSNKEDGRYELECIVEENNTSTGYFMDCFCFTGENDKWLEISNISHNNNTDLGNEFKLVGKTPITLNNDSDVIMLISKEECKYTIQSTTLSDFDTSVVTYKNISRTNNKDCIEIEATSDATIWYQNYANITISNLIVGEQYTLYINTLGISIDSTNHITNGYFTVFTSDMEIIKDGIYLNNNDKFSLPIIPTTTSIIIRWYVGDGTSFAANCKARINNIYINKGIENSSYSSPINLSGTFTGEKEFFNIKSGVTITSTPTCSVYSKETEKESKPLSGKTIVCFGDSLFGLHRGETSATSYIAEETGATVYNVGFGGCRMAQHPSTGYNEFCMYALSDSIYNENWTTQDNAVSSGEDYFTEQLNTLKNIDFNKVDIIVIHYGTNDFGGNVEIGKDDVSSITHTLCGALRHSIENLLKKYPKIKIAISVPVYRFWTIDNTITYSDTYTNTNGDKLTDFVNALISVAKEYNLPYIDNYYCMGINKINASSFLGDGTHHNMDGRKRFGEFIGSQLISKL